MAHPQTPLSEIMSSPVFGVQHGELVADVMAAGASRHVHHFPVLDGERLIGFVCMCDLEDKGGKTRVDRWMKTEPVVAGPASTAEDAARLMANRAVGSILVVEEGKLAGLVTREDLLKKVPALEALMSEARCSCCGSRQHLRPGPGGGQACVYCLERSSGKGWFDLGAGD